MVDFSEFPQVDCHTIPSLWVLFGKWLQAVSDCIIIMPVHISIWSCFLILCKTNTSKRTRLSWSVKHRLALNLYLFLRYKEYFRKLFFHDSSLSAGWPRKFKMCECSLLCKVFSSCGGFCDKCWTEYIETFGAVLNVKEALQHGSKSAFTRISLRTTK